MVYAGYPPGSYDDARVFGWQSLGKLVARWWPVYAFGILAAFAGWLAILGPLVQAAIALLLLDAPAFVTCATRFRGRFALTPPLLAGITLTYILPSIATQLVLQMSFLVPMSARYATLPIALVAAFWLSPKLFGAGCFYLLGAGRITPWQSFTLAWRFIAGDIWVTQFSVGLVGGLALIPIAIIAVLLGRVQLEPIAYIISTTGGLLLNLYYSAALMRIVSSSHELFETYWKASENTSQ